MAATVTGEAERSSQQLLLLLLYEHQGTRREEKLNSHFPLVKFLFISKYEPGVSVPTVSTFDLFRF